MRRAPSLDALIPALYLYGVSTSDFSDALESILGPHAKGLSSTNITHLKGVWQQDKQALFSFYDFSAKHWQHIRTTNPIESTFATVRHRTRKTKGCGSRAATLTMVFKLAKTAQKRWRRLKGYQLIDKIINGVQFVDGEEQNHQHHHTA